jgi:hypothetical protein
MVSPRIGHGTFLKIGDGNIVPGPETFTTVARLTEIGEFGGDVDDIDITNHDNVEAVREYIRGLAEPGEIPFTGVWIADQTQFDLHADVFAGIVPNKNFQVVLPDDMGIAEFSGFVAGFRLNPQMEDRIEFTGRIKLSGSYTLTLPS